MNYSFYIRSAIALTIIGTSPAVIAQGVFDPGVLTVTLGADAVRQSEEDRAGADAGPDLRSSIARSTRQAPRPVSSAQLSALAYRPDARVRQRNFSRFVAKARQQDATGGERLERALSGGKVIANAQSWMGRYGMSTNNVADTTATYLVIAWFGARASDQDPSPQQMRAVRNQIAAAMLGNAEFARAPSAVKQEIAEANLVQAQLVSEYATLAKGNGAMRVRVRNAVLQGARSSYGVDLSRLQLTTQGFR